MRTHITTTIVSLGFLLSSVTLFSQDIGNAADAGGLPFLATEDEMPASFSSKALESANKFVTSKKKWSLGYNPDGRYVVIGESGIPVSPDSPQFQQARSNAFDKAMLNAKEQVAKYYALQIAQEIVNTYGELGDEEARSSFDRYSAQGSGSGADPSVSGGIISKVKRLINAELDERLDEKGIDPKSGLAKEEVAKMLEVERNAPDVDSYDAFRKTIERAAQAEVGALVVSKIYEDNGNLAVVATYSDATKRLAAAFNGVGQPPKVRERKNNLQKWVSNLETKDVYSAMGVQMTSDEEGNLVMLSYAQATAKRATALARKNALAAAEATADGFIRSFVGESVAYEGALEVVESLEEFDELESAVGRLSQSREQRNQVAAKSGALKIPGIVTMKQWSTQDKRSGALIVGVVRVCSFASAQTANRERGELESGAGSRGGEGMSNNYGNPTSQGSGSNASEYKTIDKEHSDGYSNESIESEDF